MWLGSMHIVQLSGSMEDSIMEKGYVVRFYSHCPILGVNEGFNNGRGVCGYVLCALSDTPLDNGRGVYGSVLCTLSNLSLNPSLTPRIGQCA